MAFTFDTKATLFDGLQNSTVVTLSYTCAANTRLLVLGIATKAITVRTGGAPTYNGVAMTQVGTTQVGATECTCELWYLVNPATGAAYNISVPKQEIIIIRLIASSYIDAGVTSAALDQYNQTNVDTANPSLSVTTGFDGEAIVDMFGSGLTAPGTGNRTLLYATDEGIWSSMAQYNLQASAGTIAFTWTIASDDVAFIVGAFKGVAAGGQTYECSASDGLKAGEALATQCVFGVSVTDGLKSGDTPAGLGIFGKLASNGVKLGDTSLAGLVYSLLSSDGLKVEDSPVAGLLCYLSTTDGLKLSEALATLKQTYPSLTDGLRVGDTLTTQAILNALASEGVKLSDSVLAGLVYNLIATEGIKLSDEIIAGLVYNILASDGIKLGDAVVLAKALVISALLRLLMRSRTANLYSRNQTATLFNRSKTIELWNRSLTVNLFERSLTVAMKGD